MNVLLITQISKWLVFFRIIIDYWLIDLQNEIMEEDIDYWSINSMNAVSFHNWENEKFYLKTGKRSQINTVI